MNEGPWVWLAEPCSFCGTAITCSKVPILSARQEIMVRELAHYMRHHVTTKHRDVRTFTYVPNPLLFPASVRVVIG